MKIKINNLFKNFHSLFNVYGFLFLVYCSLYSCGVYSFSGANVPKEVKTISIAYIENKAPNAWSSVDRIFNQELRKKLVQESGLKLVNENGDYQVNGRISNYIISAQTPTQGQFSTQYRLEISAQLEFKDIVTEKKTQWNQTFSNFENYENDIAGREDIFIKSISEKIASSIFNQLFSNW